MLDENGIRSLSHYHLEELGRADIRFLERAFQGRKVFTGGFLGLAQA